MIRNILRGIFFFSAIALSSCSTQNKMSSVAVDDDVYNTKAKAGDAPVYAVRQNTYRQDNNNDSQYIDDDYGYYDSYSARLNRFYNNSQFLSSYYDDLYYGGCTPYYSGNSLGFGLGFGLGYGNYGGGYFGYNPYTYYGYNPYWGYSNYGYYGSTIGYGASPYWGTYSYYNVARTYNNPRPYRGSGLPGVGGITSVSNNRSGTMVSYGNNNSYFPVRGNNNVSSGRATNSTNGNNGNSGYARPVRTTEAAPRPVYQPQSQPQTQSAPASSSGSSSSGSSSSGGGGGGRPVRP